MQANRRNYLQDPRRLTALQKTSLLQGEAEGLFDRYTRLGGRLLQVPYCLFTLVSADRVHHKSTYCAQGALDYNPSLTYSFCQHVVSARQEVAIEDTRLHPQTRLNPAIEEYSALAFLGVPVRSPDGEVLGSLCALDVKPHAWTPEEREALSDLAIAVANEIAVRWELRKRRFVEDKLRGSEERYRQALEASPDLVWETDAEGRLCYINQQCLHILGYEAQALIGQNWARLRAHRSDEVQAALARLLQSGAPFQGLETTVLRKDGAIVKLESSATPILGEQGETVGVLGVSRDVSARNRMDGFLRDVVRSTSEEIAQANRSLMRSQRMARLTNWSWSGPGGTLSWLEGAQSLLGLEARGETSTLEAFLDRVEEADRPALLQSLADCRSLGTSVDVRFRLETPEKVLRALAEAVPGEGHQVTVVGTFQDITEQEALQSQLRQSQKMDAVGRLASGIAHDFNNLLCGILGFAEFAVDEVGADHPAAGDLDEVLKAGRRAESLTRQLLLFSSQTASYTTDVDVNDTVEDISRMLQRLIGGNIRYTQKLADGLWNVRMDRSALEQVLVNLAVNARDAMPHGGTLIISTRNQRVPTSMTSHYQNLAGDYVVLEVSDTGEGIPASVLPRIFEPFFTTKEVGRGTGLGLSVCFGILEQMKGAIDVATTADEGTRFSLYLPRQENLSRPAAPEEDMPERYPLGRGELVIVVEDDELVRTMVARTLTRLGYTARAFASPQEALAELPKLPLPELLLTNYTLPGQNGVELSAAATAVYPGLKTLLTSAFLPEALADSNLPVLIKPFGQERLALAVRAALDRATSSF